jgi:acetate CoA/acetoacetate CoA-transferase beta subunit
LPITAPRVVKLVATDLGLFEITAQGLTLREFAPGWTPEEIQALTAAKLQLADDLREFRCRD